MRLSAGLRALRGPPRPPAAPGRASFAASAPRGARRRPAGGRAGRAARARESRDGAAFEGRVAGQVDVADAALDGAGAGQFDIADASYHGKDVAQVDIAHAAFGETDLAQVDDDTSPPAPSPPADKHILGLNKQAVASFAVIRKGPDGPLTATAGKDDAHRLGAAQRFFKHGCQFLYSAEEYRHHPPNRLVPEVVVLGASNVGKSSFLNALVGRAGLARVSQRPGRTTVMNGFGVGPGLARGGSPPPAPAHGLVLVDTPGYGYRSHAQWGAAVCEYLERRPTLRGAVLLLSSEKQRPLADDEWMLAALAERNARVLVVLTKADKGRRAWAGRCADMADRVLGMLPAADAGRGVFVTAAGVGGGGPGGLGNGAGMGGVRAAILDMAGFAVRDAVTKAAENESYGGPVVAFEDVRWR